MAATTPETYAPFATSFIKMIEQNRVMLEKTLRTTQEESLRFLNRRLEHNAKALESLQSCDGISGLWAIEQEWLTESLRDYMEQTQRLSKFLWQMGDEQLNATVERAAEGPMPMRMDGKSHASERARKTQEPRAAA